MCTCAGSAVCVQHSGEDTHSENGVGGVTMHVMLLANTFD